jgi:hypothetical protein
MNLKKKKINILLDDVLGSWCFLLAKVHLILFVFDSSLFKPKKKKKKKKKPTQHTHKQSPHKLTYYKVITKPERKCGHTHHRTSLSLSLSCTNFITIQ